MAYVNSVEAARTTTGANLSLNITSLAVPGNILILEMGVNVGSVTFSVAGSTFSPIPSVSAMNVNSAQGSITGNAFYRIADGTETTITISGGGTRLYIARCRSYSGRNATPFAVTPVTTGPVGAASPPLALSITGITPNSGDDLVLLLIGGQSDTTSDVWTFTQPSGWGNTFADQAPSIQFAPNIFSCDLQNVSNTATGTLTGTLTNSSLTTMGYGVYLISLGSGALALMPFNQTQFFVTDTIVQF